MSPCKHTKATSCFNLTFLEKKSVCADLYLKISVIAKILAY